MCGVHTVNLHKCILAILLLLYSHTITEKIARSYSTTYKCPSYSAWNSHVICLYLHIFQECCNIAFKRKLSLTVAAPVVAFEDDLVIWEETLNWG